MEITTVLSVWESFIFEDETEYEYEIQVKVFVRVLKKRHPGDLHFTFFHQKSWYGHLYWRRLSLLPMAQW